MRAARAKKTARWYETYVTQLLFAGAYAPGARRTEASGDASGLLLSSMSEMF